MQFLTYFALSIAAFLGLLLGILLIRFAPEEQKPGRPYFKILKKIVFILMISFLFFFFEINVIVMFLIIGSLCFLVLTKRLNLEKNSLVYALLGLIFFVSSYKSNLFVLQSILIFIYGLPVASLTYEVKKNNYVEIFLKNGWYFVPVVLLPLVL